MTVSELLTQLSSLVKVHLKAKDATVHVVEGGRDEGLLHAIRYKGKSNIVILEGDPKAGALRHTKKFSPIEILEEEKAAHPKDYE